ncbi:TerD family protein [Rhodococcus sp. IEGM 1366]|uniref:TerD family protein n=1 Tax=Rhodococcus sp. IEGM 1366 TaxID=3082223 RepID=UPI002952E55B|nr:TerD family protein [Rhodococcus sp. IEGM 1366]MDV8071125.1 TerD family protein [Rhodococcus sp. IEGM 1366]
MMTTLARGENTTLSHQRIIVTASGVDACTVDLLGFQLGMNEKVRSDEDLIFINSPISLERAVALSGDRVDINLHQVPAVVQFLPVAVSLDDSVTGSLATITALGVTLCNELEAG